MKRILGILILGVATFGCLVPAGAAPVPSDWPALNYNAAGSNNNVLETTLTTKNVLKLRVKWTAPIADVSYPIVAAGRVYIPIPSGHKIHVLVLDAVTGRAVARYPKDALGGLLSTGGNVYLAGHVLQSLDPATGQRVAQITAPPNFTGGGVFLDPVADARIILVGFASAVRKPSANLLTIDPSSNLIVRTLASLNAWGAIGSNGRIATETSAGSTFYDEGSGHALSKQPRFFSTWFAGDTLTYTVASVNRKDAAVYALDPSGHRVWSRAIGPPLNQLDWPHAVSSTAVYVQAFHPQQSIQALDPLSGHVLWSHPVPDLNRIAVANGVVYGLSYGLGQPLKLVALNAKNGKSLGAIVLSSGYYGFYTANGLMVANGMAFMRAVGPGGSKLIALGLPG